MDAVFLSGPLKGQLPVGQRTIEVRVTFDLRRQFLACCQVETTKLTVWIPFALTQHLVWAEVVALCHHVKPKYFEDLAGTLATVTG